MDRTNLSESTKRRFLQNLACVDDEWTEINPTLFTDKWREQLWQCRWRYWSCPAVQNLVNVLFSLLQSPTSHNWLALPDCHATINDLNAVWWHANPDDSTKLLYRHRLLTGKPSDALPFSSEEGDSHEFDAVPTSDLSYPTRETGENVLLFCVHVLVITVW